MLTHHTKRAPMRHSCVSRSRVHSRRRMMFRCADYTLSGTARAGGEVTHPPQWSSEYNDEETNLVYYNYRYYNPTVGRWTRRDPIGRNGAYFYLRNDVPINIDVLGRESLQDWITEFLRELDIDKIHKDLIAIVASQGCVGVTSSILGQVTPDLSHCYGSETEARNYMEKTKCCNINLKGIPAQSRLFSIHTYEGKVICENKYGNIGTYYRRYKQNGDGTYDLADALTPCASGVGMGNYDFAILLDQVNMIGATEGDPAIAQEILSKLNMDVAVSPHTAAEIVRRTIDEWKKELENNPSYNREFWCVTCESNQLATCPVTL